MALLVLQRVDGWEGTAGNQEDQFCGQCKMEKENCLGKAAQGEVERKG